MFVAPFRALSVYLLPALRVLFDFHSLFCGLWPSQAGLPPTFLTCRTLASSRMISAFTPSESSSTGVKT